MRTALYDMGGLAVIVFFVVRQRRSDRHRERSLILPLALGSMVISFSALGQPGTRARRGKARVAGRSGANRRG